MSPSHAPSDAAPDVHPADPARPLEPEDGASDAPDTAEDIAADTAAAGDDDATPKAAPADGAAPIDAEFTPAPEPDPSQTPPRGGVSFAMAAALAAAAAVAGGYMGVVFDTQSPGAAPQRLAALEAQLAALSAAPAAPAPSSIDTDALAPLAERLSALEAQTAALARRRPDPGPASAASDSGPGASPDTAASVRALELAEALEPRVAAAGGRLEALDARMTAFGDRLDALEARVAALDSTTERMAVQVTGEAPAADAPTGAARADGMLALAALREAALTAGAFVEELSQARAFFPDEPVLEALEPYAANGAWSRARVDAEFREVARAAIALERGGQAGLLERMSLGVADLVSVQRVDAPDGSRAAGDVVLRARAFLAEDDLDAAADAMAALRPPAFAEAEPWIAQARARAGIDAALAELGGAEEAPDAPTSAEDPDAPVLTDDGAGAQEG